VSWHPEYPGRGAANGGLRCALLLEAQGLKVNIEGDNATIIWRGEDREDYGSFLVMHNTGPDSRLRISGLRFRYEHKPFVTGTVFGIVGSTAEPWQPGDHLLIDLDEHPKFADVQWMQSFRDGLPLDVPYSEHSGYVAGGSLEPDESGPDLRYRLDTSGNERDDYGVLLEGDRVALLHQKYQTHFVQANNVGTVYLDDLELNHCAGPVIRVNGARTAVAHGVRIVPDPELHVSQSVNAGGIIFAQARFAEVVDCISFGTGDDTINVGSTTHPVTSFDADPEVLSLSGPLRAPYVMPWVGDMIQVYDANRVCSEHRVVTATGNHAALDGTGGTYEITVDTPWTAGTPAEISIVCESGNISSNTVGRNRGRGIAASLRGGVIAANHVDGSSGSSILLASQTQQHVNMRAVAVLSNVLSRSNPSDEGSAQAGAAISVEAMLSDNQTQAPAPIHENLSIAGNTISHTAAMAILAHGVSGLAISENVLHEVGVQAKAQNAGAGLKPWSAGIGMGLLRCDKVIIANNRAPATTPLRVETQNCTDVMFGANDNVEPSLTANVPDYRVPSSRITAPAIMRGVVLPQTAKILQAVGENEASRWGFTRVMDDAIADCIDAGLWDAWDIFYLFANYNAALAHINWKVPGRFTLTKVETPTFTQYQGYKGNGSNQYFNTGFAFELHAQPEDEEAQYAQNSAHIFTWHPVSDTTTADDYVFGVSGGSDGHVRFRPRGASGRLFASLNDQTDTDVAANADVQGVYVLNRAAGDKYTVYKDNVLLGTPMVNSAGVPDLPGSNRSYLYLLAENAASVEAHVSAREIGAFGLGGSSPPARSATSPQSSATSNRPWRLCDDEQDRGVCRGQLYADDNGGHAGRSECRLYRQQRALVPLRGTSLL
jgi:hypothetical protein